MKTLLAMVMCPVLVRAEVSDNPNENAWVTNGVVYSIVRSGSTTYIGGLFSMVGPRTGGGVPVGSVSGAIVSPFPLVAGSVNDAVSDGSGGWYIGGDFSAVGGVAIENLAHILSNGTVDTSWHPNPNDYVTALALSGETIYVAGSFASISGQDRNRLAALDAEGNATPWRTSTNGAITDLIVSGTTVYVLGNFTSIGGQTRNMVGALNVSDGLATDWNPNQWDGSVNAVAVAGGIVYLGGGFDFMGGQLRHNLAAVSTSGNGPATGWDPSPNGQVRSVAVSDGTVYVGGDFTVIGEKSRNKLAALNASGTGLATDWNPSPNGRVTTFAVSGGTVYAGGTFTSIGGQSRNKIAALDSSGTGALKPWNPNPDGPVNVLNAFGGTIYIGGSFNSLGGQPRNNIAALDASGTVIAWDPNANQAVNALAVSGDGTAVYAGGKFTFMGGQSRNKIAALDANGNAMGWDPNVTGNVNALALVGGTLYVGGAFTQINGQAVTNIAALNTSGTPLVKDWKPNANGQVYTLGVSGDGTVYAGGDFTSIGTRALTNIAALAANGVANPTWNPSPNGIVRALGVSGGTVYVGGDFTSIGGATRNKIAALTVSGVGAATAWDPNITGPYVRALAVSGETVIVGGLFSSIGGETRNNIAALNASGITTAWNPNASGLPASISEVYSLVADGGTVYAGGNFTKMGNTPRGNFAQFGTGVPTAPSITDQPANWTATVGQTASFSVTATGTSPLTYQWRKNGVNIGGATSSTYTTPATIPGDNGALYSVVVTNAVGSATSNSATLTVTIVVVAPSITVHPANKRVAVGEAASFSVTATGTSPLTYQWRKNGVNIGGATSSTYTTPATVAGDNGALYSVVVTNAVGSATSNNATLTVTEAGESSVDNVLVYPNPYVQSRGHSDLTIDQLTAGATVKIYSMDGRLVKSLTATTFRKAVWAGVRDDSGEPVASGVYFGVAEGNGSKKNVKIVIQR